MSSLAERSPGPRPRGPRRPTHHGEEQNVRVPRETVVEDYPTEEYPTPEYGPKPVPDPVLVSVIEPIPAAQPLFRFSAMTLTVEPGRKENIGGADRNRRKMIVKNNDDATSVYILGGKFDIAANGYLLKAGEELEMNHTAEVYVLNADAVESVNVSVYAEYSIPEN